MRLAAALFALVLCAPAAYAQQPVKQARDAYDRGVKAIKDKQWDAAIQNLNAAIAADPRDRTWKESTIDNEYYPHFLLFKAYLETGNVVKAREAYASRGVKLPKDLAAEDGPLSARLESLDRVTRPYRDGVQAIRDQKWQEAVGLLETAIKADPNPHGGADPYFPQFYLAVANVNLDKLPEAKANFDKRGPVPRDLYLAAEYSTRIQNEIDYANHTATAKAAASAGQYPQAIDAWNKACVALPNKCAELRPQIADAQASLKAVQQGNDAKRHVAAAQSLMSDGDLDGARGEFRKALDADANNQDAKDGTKKIEDLETTYRNARARGEQAAKAGKTDEAVRGYNEARAAAPRWFARDKLDVVLATWNSQRMQTQGADMVVAEAQAAFKEKRYDAAKQAAETVLRKEPNNTAMKAIVTRSESQMLFEDGRRMAAAGDYLQAEEKYKLAIAKDADNAAANQALQTSVTYKGLVAQKLFPQAQKTDRVRFDFERPDRNFDVLDAVNRASEAFDNRDYGSAKTKIAEVLNRDPTNMAAAGLRRRIDAVFRVTPAPLLSIPTPTFATTLPLVPIWAWSGVAATFVAGIFSLVIVRRRTPVPVAIDSLPWGRVSILPIGRFTNVDSSERITPFLVNLPGGEYDLRVTSDSQSQPYNMRIRVTRGQANKVVVTMPAYDVDEILSSILG